MFIYEDSFGVAIGNTFGWVLDFCVDPVEPYLTNKQLQRCTKCSLTKEPCTGYISSYIRCTTLYLVAEEGSQFRGAYSYITIMSNFIGSYGYSQPVWYL